MRAFWMRALTVARRECKDVLQGEGDASCAFKSNMTIIRGLVTETSR